MIDERWAIFAGLMDMAGAGYYAWLTLHGKVRPNRMSWLLWALAPMVAFAAQLSKGVGLESFLTFAVGFGPIIVLIASYLHRGAYWELEAVDYVCGAISILALVLWAVTGEGNIAIGLSILADLAAAVPTLRKAYLDPTSESPWPFWIGVPAAGLNLLTLRAFNFESAAFSVYIMLICLAIASLATWPKLRLGRVAAKN